MSDIKTLEQAVEALAPDALAEFRRWFAEFDAAAWEAQIENDVAAGKLDALIAAAEEDLASPSSRPL